MAKKDEELEKAEGKAERATDKANRLVERGLFVGGVIGGAALGAVLDLKLRPIFGLPPSLFLGAVGIGLVTMNKLSKKNEGTILALSLGMVAPVVYTRTAGAVAAGMFGGILGNGGNGNGGGNGGGNGNGG